MVMTVCRGVLRDPIDAEDAFQATFLVLAQKAGSAWVEGQLGGWLHRVAYRIAVRASMDAARRREHERQAAEVAAVSCTHVGSDDDIQPALHEELVRLPARFRVPVVLCYLEGLTHAQAALELSCGEATVRRAWQVRASGCAIAWCAGVCTVGRGVLDRRQSSRGGFLFARRGDASRGGASRRRRGSSRRRGGQIGRSGEERDLAITSGSGKTTAAAVIAITAAACLAAGIGAGLVAAAAG